MSASKNSLQRAGAASAARRADAPDDRADMDAGELRALAARLTEENAALASLSNFLQTHSEREKAQLARELHDSLGGILTPAKMDLAWLQARLGEDPQYGPRMKRLGALIDQGIDLKRRIIETLRPSLLDHLGLASALQWYVDEACRGAQIECRLHVGDPLERLPPDLEIALYRVLQEGIDNACRHAQARVLDITVERRGSGVHLVIADDGAGIADLERARHASHGLAGMMHRVRSVGGTFEVQSAPGKGTRITIFVPLAAG
ncbi:MAG TPA: sensor histidine kinase [Myxococcota bacterium]|nr:sensor histidine kinase [Myxococcota bacterium]